MSIWRNAFKIGYSRQLTNDEIEFIVKIASKIKGKKLEDIALLIVEGTRPIHNLAANLIYFSKPIFGFIFSNDEMTKLAEILENPNGLEFFKQQLREDKNG
ncbi:MAG: hypothetical protein ACP5IO_04170 [Elusimicrobiales bacterium]